MKTYKAQNRITGEEWKTQDPMEYRLVMGIDGALTVLHFIGAGKVQVIPLEPKIWEVVYVEGT